MTRAKIVTIDGHGSSHSYVYIELHYKNGPKWLGRAVANNAIADISSLRAFVERNGFELAAVETVHVGNGTVYCPNLGVQSHPLAGFID